MAKPLIETRARRAILRRVGQAVLQAAHDDGVTLVAVDGVDGAGKTTFADELIPFLRPRTVIRASVDSFHHPQAERYARGRESPEGFYRDSYDYATLSRLLLEPLRSGEQFGRAVFDVGADQPIDAPLETAPPGSILLFDGIFLHRPELRDHWDFSIYLDVPWEKNHHLPGHPEWDRLRYSEGQAMYLRECRPEQLADVVIDNSDLREPRLVRSPS